MARFQADRVTTEAQGVVLDGNPLLLNQTLDGWADFTFSLEISFPGGGRGDRRGHGARTYTYRQSNVNNTMP